MTDNDITSALLSSGPAGVALAFLGVVIRGWIQRLEATVDKMGSKFESLQTTMQRREVELTRELTELQEQLKRHSSDLNHLGRYVSADFATGSISTVQSLPPPNRRKEES
jgi:hypothetical protein